MNTNNSKLIPDEGGRLKRDNPRINQESKHKN
jgi:hypothetical protein